MKRFSESIGYIRVVQTSAWCLPNSGVASNSSINRARLSGERSSRKAMARSTVGITPVMSRLARRRNSASSVGEDA